MTFDGRARILLVHWGRSGGGPRFTHQLGQALADGKREIHVSYASNSEIARSWDDLDVKHLPLRTFESTWGSVAGIPRLLWFCFKLRRYIRRHRIGIIVFGMEQLWQGIASPMLFGSAPQFLVIHDAVQHPGEASTFLRLASFLQRRCAARCIALSPTVRDQLLATSKANPGKFMHSYLPSAPPVRAKPRSIRRLERPIVGFFGRIQEYKGITYFAQAASLARDEALGYRFEVHGQGQLPNADMSALHLFVGWVPENEILQTLDTFDLLVLPYIEASQSGVLVEAARLGLPVVVTDVGGLVEQLGSQPFGLIVTPGDPHALLEAVKEILEDGQTYAHLSNRALMESDRLSDWTHLVSTILEGAESVCTGQK